MVQVRPLTVDRWADLERAFGHNGFRRGCWCMAWRLSSSEWARSNVAGRRAALKALVDAGHPVGLLAYVGDDPVGWCSLAPVEQHGRLMRSRTLPQPDDGPGWALTCFFVRAGSRRQGAAQALVSAAVGHAAASGAVALYAYPGRNAERKPDSRGSIAMFLAAGFREVASRSTYFVFMRRDLSPSEQLRRPWS